MDLEKIRELLKIVADSGVSEVEIEEDDFKLVVRKNSPTVTLQPQSPSFGMPYPMPAYPQQGYSAPAQASVPQAPAPEAVPSEAAVPDEGKIVHAPIVGTFYTRPSPDSEPYVMVGDRVNPGDVLCIIEAMKLMNEIECEVAGTIRQILVEDAQPVEFDQPLFVID